MATNTLSKLVAAAASIALLAGCSSPTDILPTEIAANILEEQTPEVECVDGNTWSVK